MRGSETVRIEDLTGGINQLDYPSEIDNKQAQDITNFNFDGNRLISSKGLEQEVSGTEPIQGIKLDSNDVWHISNGTLYKNDGVEPELLGADITFNTLPFYWSQFSSGLYYYINIDGTEYEIVGATPEDRKNSLVGQLSTNVYDIRDRGVDKIFLGRIDFQEPIITVPNYLSVVIGIREGGDGLDAIYSDRYGTNTVYLGGIEVDGQFYRDAFRPNSNATIRENATNMVENLKSQFPSEFNVSVYEFDNENDLNPVTAGTGNSVGYLLNKFTSTVGSVNTNINTDIITIETTSSSYSVTVLGNTYSGTFPAGDLQSLKNDLDSKLPTTIGIMNVGSIFGTGYFYTNSVDGAIYLYDEANGFLSFDLQIDGGAWGSNFGVIMDWEDSSKKSTTLDFAYTIGSTVSAINFEGITDITIGNQMELLLSRDDGGAAVFVDNIYNPIGEDAVGKPTVGTIYNGKIVLGGYPDNDNIVFSKTATPSNPLIITEFDGYDAGGQSVSGGDKGRVTGMTVSENGLYVFKDNSIWYTNSEKDNPDSLSFNFVFRKITSSGAYSQGVITQVGQDVFYLDWKERAVRRLSYEQNLTTLRDTAISREIEPILRDLPEDQSLAVSNYTYPNYRIYLSDHTGPTITYPNGKTYNTNNLCFTYNVFNKSWTKEEIGNVVVANESVVGLSDNNIYSLEKGSLNKPTYYKSKRYSEGDDFIKKKYSRVELLAKLIPESGESLTITVNVKNSLGETVSSFSHTSTEEESVPLRKHLYFISETITFEIECSGNGRAEVYDLFYSFKPTKIGR